MIAIILCVLVLLLALPYFIFRRLPKPNKNETYDYILILGCPCEEDGSISSAQRQRILAAIHYYQAGLSSTIICSGAAVKNQYVEAECMARELKKTLPQATIRIESNARNTFQNMQFTKQTYPAEKIIVVSGPSHLRRAGFFVRKFYSKAALGCAEAKDPWHFYLWEYTRMWVAIYWEIKLSRKKHH